MLLGFAFLFLFEGRGELSPAVNEGVKWCLEDETVEVWCDACEVSIYKHKSDLGIQK